MSKYIDNVWKIERLKSPNKYLLDFWFGDYVFNYSIIIVFVIYNLFFMDDVLNDAGIYLGLPLVVKWIVTVFTCIMAIFLFIYFVRVRYNLLYFFWYVVISALMIYGLFAGIFPE